MRIDDDDNVRSISTPEQFLRDLPAGVTLEVWRAVVLRYNTLVLGLSPEEKAKLDYDPKIIPRAGKVD